MTRASKRHPSNQNGVWQINNSSLDLIQSCFRKAHYTFSNPTIETGSLSTAFGSAIHKALEAYYLTPRVSRGAEMLKAAFDEAAKASHIDIPLEDDKRSIRSGHIILDAYHATYGDDTFEVYSDQQGPLVERSFEVDLAEGIRFYGQVDLVLKNTENGQLYIFDHKTTTSLSGFAERVSPNHQITGYIWALQSLGINVQNAILQGIKVTKFVRSQPEFMRVDTFRTDEQLAEWKEWAIFTAKAWNHASQAGIYPMNGSSACTAYGGCRFKDVCSAPTNMRGDILSLLATKTMEIEE
jgi:RecB family exonuclease